MKVVEENPDLVRDPSSGAIVNRNKSAYEAALTAARRAKETQQEINEAFSDINNLKEEMADIKSILNKILEKV